MRQRFDDARAKAGTRGRIALGHARGSRYLLLRVDFIKLCGGTETSGGCETGPLRGVANA